MADLDHQHDKPLILDIANDAIVSDLIAPIAAKGVAFESLTQLARVLVSCQALIEEGNNTCCLLLT